ncbi:uncharacterized protein RAG0_04925 [Rhynchosporium agropyri]|uniref:Uncharacterized protein n=1 Tax=Rhynchosporium agropyri TaxID=914238 RepID=A0A1E1KAS2_9HELO|nr:uncharacterized protein RAG0_04925 [Rhynchosporium agropyri]
MRPLHDGKQSKNLLNATNILWEVLGNLGNSLQGQSDYPFGFVIVHDRIEVNICYPEQNPGQCY